MVKANTSPIRARLLVFAALAALIAGMLPGTLSVLAKDAKEPVTIQFLNVSDWHGQIDPLDVFGVGMVGGAAVLSSYWQADRAANPNTVTLTGGDDFGASPPLSNFFNEETAILAQRMMGIQFGTFGNHNFDSGVGHLQQMIDLARDPSAGVPGDPLQYVSANLLNVKGTLRHAKPYEIVKVGGVKVAFVGLTNPEAPELVFPGSFGPIVITDPIAAANAAQAAARNQGAQIVVAMIHAGVRGFDSQTQAPFGELIDFANGVSGFDVIFGDHTDVQFSGMVNGALVLENRSKGLTYAKTQVTFDPGTNMVTDRSTAFVTPFASNVTPDPAVEAVLQPFRDALEPILGTVVGESSVAVPRADSCGQSAGRTCESLVGNIVTDAMRETYGTDFAITNSGGLRADLTCPEAGGGPGFCPTFTAPPYQITRGQVLTVLPFGNQSVTFNLNGAELKSMLENGVSAMPGVSGRYPQVSGLCFSYDIDLAAGSRVTGAVFQAEDGSCTGAAVDLTAGTSYSLTTNDFMAFGGDGYPVFSDRMVTRNLMDNDVAAWIEANTPISPVLQGRIACSGATCPVTLP